MATAASLGRARATPTAIAMARVEWLLGNDQSPTPGHGSTAVTPLSARQGRSSSTIVFRTSLIPYATTVATPASTTAATVRASPRRSPRQPVHTSSSPSTTSVPSVARPSDVPTQPGASAAAPASDR